MRAFCPTRPPACRPKVMSGGAFNPDDIATILQNLGSPLTYADSPLGTIPVLESSIGEVGTPRGQRCYLADGSNDTIVWTAADTGTQYVTYYNPATASWSSPASLTHNGSAYVFAPGNIRFYNLKRWSISNPTDAQIQSTTLAAAQGSGGLVSWHWCQEESGTKSYDSANATPKDGTLTNVNTSSFHSTHAGVAFSGPNEYGYTLSSSVVIPRNEAAPTLDCEGDALETPGPIWLSGVMEVNAWTGNGSNAYINAGTSPLSGTNGFTIGIWYYCSQTDTRERLVDIRINAGTATFSLITNANAVIAHVAAGVAIQVVGFTGPAVTSALTIGKWHYIEATRSGSSLSLSVTPVGGSPVTNTATISGDFSSSMLLAGGAFNSSGTPTVDTLPLAGSICGLSITTGGVTYYPLFDQCGPGPSNTNRDFYIVGSDGSATLVTGGVINGTISDIYANKCPYVRDWCIENGGGIAANGSFVPGIPGSANDAAGNVKTLAAGKRGNPYSKLLRNYFSAPALVNIGCTSSDKEAPGYDVQSESVADTRFRRSSADGDDRDLSFSEAQTGETLANIEEWTS